MDNGAISYRRFLEGDDSGFVDIVREYNDGLVLYLNSIVGNIAVADEISEDVFVKLGVKRPHFAGKSSFKSWIYAIGRNAALVYLRKAGKEPFVAYDDYVTDPDEETLENRYIKQEEKITLHRAINRLKPNYRQVIWLLYFEGFDTRQTARIMKKSVHNIEVTVSRARQALKEILNEEGFNREEL